MRRLNTFVPAAVLLALAVAVPAMPARGDEPAPAAKCAVRTIHALKEGSGGAGATIDPRISGLRAYLEKPPFTSWKAFRLLDDKEVMLQPHGSSPFELPNGRHGSLTYLDHLIGDGEHRMRLQLTLSDGTKKVLNTTFVLDEGGVVLQAGQRYQNGLLILGISCQTEK